MGFLVRKLANKNHIDLIKTCKNILEIDADIISTEFRTSKNSLSTWRIEKIEDVNEAILAIISTSERYSKMDFIVIDEEYLKERSLKYEQTFAGKEIPIKELQNTHFDLQELSLAKIIDCINVYQMIGTNDSNNIFVFRKTESEVKKLFKNAIDEGRVQIELLSNELKP